MATRSSHFDILLAEGVNSGSWERDQSKAIAVVTKYIYSCHYLLNVGYTGYTFYYFVRFNSKSFSEFSLMLKCKDSVNLELMIISYSPFFKPSKK